MGPTITVMKNVTSQQEFRDALAKLQRMEVLVGIPQERASRRGDKINNAELMFIMTNGSPKKNIPPRPVIEPAINSPGNREIIAQELQEAAAAMLRGGSSRTAGPDAALRYLKRAGIAGQNAARSWFTDARNQWPPNAPSTIRRKGSDRPLIDTRALRDSIVFVIRGDTGQPTQVQQLELDNAKKSNP